ncbi:hypothetical protein HMPREF0183_1169 [Brevibacterium mcbrellneri ATCC 49030]|uniref:Uncharacterized protein n=1 Tax=Brevibacterium mcbrellneri ATCC 49030 TaxID=585530 RepID=D4YMK9_9MICO|nr:hypothetical protein HMPREF0183_1169 [Brevibacterium mcbrellneri ATCC 49030]
MLVKHKKGGWLPQVCEIAATVVGLDLRDEDAPLVELPDRPARLRSTCWRTT